MSMFSRALMLQQQKLLKFFLANSGEVFSTHAVHVNHWTVLED